MDEEMAVMSEDGGRVEEMAVMLEDGGRGGHVGRWRSCRGVSQWGVRSHWVPRAKFGGRVEASIAHVNGCEVEVPSARLRTIDSMSMPPFLDRDKAVVV